MLLIYVLRRNDSDTYRNQPGRIEDYEPGRSSIAQQQPVKQVYFFKFYWIKLNS